MATDVPCFDKLEGLAVGGTATVMSAITGARPLRLNGARRWVLTLECTHLTRGVSLIRWRRRGYEGDGGDNPAWPWSPWVTSTVTLTASGGATPTGTLSDQINRTLWIRGIVLDSDSPGFVIVTAASVAGIPINVGSKGAPIRMWSHDSTRVSFEFAPRMAMVGQTVSVSVQNIDAAAGHSASGGLVADEINPFAFQRTMEAMLLAGLGVQAEV